MVLPTWRWQGRPPRRRSLWRRLASWRPMLLLAILVVAWNALDAFRIEPLPFLATAPEAV